MHPRTGPFIGAEHGSVTTPTARLGAGQGWPHRSSPEPSPTRCQPRHRTAPRPERDVAPRTGMPGAARRELPPTAGQRRQRLVWTARRRKVTVTSPCSTRSQARGSLRPRSRPHLLVTPPRDSEPCRLVQAGREEEEVRTCRAGGRPRSVPDQADAPREAGGVRRRGAALGWRTWNLCPFPAERGGDGPRAKCAWYPGRRRPFWGRRSRCWEEAGRPLLPPAAPRPLPPRAEHGQEPMGRRAGAPRGRSPWQQHTRRPGMVPQAGQGADTRKAAHSRPERR